MKDSEIRANFDRLETLIQHLATAVRAGFERTNLRFERVDARNHNVLLAHGGILSIDADPRTVAVGGAVALRTFLGMTYSQPEIVSGAIIEVPEKPTEKTSAWETWSRVIGTLGTLAIAYAAISR